MTQHQPRPKSQAINLDSVLAFEQDQEPAVDPGPARLRAVEEEQSNQQDENQDAAPATDAAPESGPVSGPEQGAADDAGNDGPEDEDTEATEQGRRSSSLAGLDSLPVPGSDEDPSLRRPAEEGWRGRINALTGSLLNLKPDAREMRRRRSIIGIQTNLARPMTVLVANAAGGSGKTVTSIGLGSTFGYHRGGEVVIWDNNETHGSLALRTKNQNSSRTVIDLLESLGKGEQQSLGDLSPYLRRQGNSKVEVLAASTNPGLMTQIGSGEFDRVHEVLAQFKQLILVDSGNNCIAENFQAAADRADLVLIPLDLTYDVVQRALWTARALGEAGHEDLIKRAVIVVTHGSRGKESAKTSKDYRKALEEHFVDVVDIPYDSQLDRGSAIDLELLADGTRRAYEQLAAVVATRLNQLPTK